MFCKRLNGKCRFIIVLVTLTAALAVNAAGAEYFVSSIRGDAAGTGSQDKPWHSLASIDNYAFKPGDKINFERGSTFTGGFTISSSGSEGKPITYTAYGTGSAPKFSNPDYAVLNGNAIRVDGSYIVIDGLYFYDCATAPPRTRGASHKVGAIFISTTGEHNIIQNCEVTNSPMCIHVYGQHNLVTRNYIHDLDNLPSRGWWGVGIMICNSNNEVSYNEIVNCRQKHDYYGWDGGAIELDDRDYPKDNISVHHNRSRDNQGFLEIVEGSASVKNLLVAYNVVNDYQQFLRLSSTEIENCRVENNTVMIRESFLIPSMFDFSWFGTTGIGKSYGTRDPSSILTYRNNIFYLRGNDRVSPYGDFPHDHNIYWRPRDRAMRGWALLGADAELGVGDKIADPKLVNLAEGDFHLQPDSPAIGAGVALGYKTDVEGKPVPATSPDIGAYQHQ
jgi:hypothetical protein